MILNRKSTRLLLNAMLCVELTIAEATHGAGAQRLLHLHTGWRFALHFDHLSPLKHVYGNHLGGRA